MSHHHPWLLYLFHTPSLSSPFHTHRPTLAEKGKDNPDEDEPLSTEEQSLYLQRVAESLKHKLVMQTNKASGAEAVVRELRQRLFDLLGDYKDEKQKTLEIASDMTRQYKG